MAHGADESGERSRVGGGINLDRIVNALVLAGVVGLLGWVMSMSSTVAVNTIQVSELNKKTAVVEADAKVLTAIVAQRGERITRLEAETSGLRNSVDRIERSVEKIAEKVGAK